MKYETPKLTALTPAINAVQSSIPTNKGCIGVIDSTTGDLNDAPDCAYMNWED
jgi:hypothetical protein